HDDELPRLRVARATCPSRGFEDLLDDVVGDGVARELPYLADAADGTKRIHGTRGYDRARFDAGRTMRTWRISIQASSSVSDRRCVSPNRRSRKLLKRPRILGTSIAASMSRARSPARSAWSRTRTRQWTRRGDRVDRVTRDERSGAADQGAT